jgi:hypothetical protein
MRTISLLSLLAIGCAPERLAPPAGGEGVVEREPVDVTLTFRSDWTVAASGPIVEGATVRVDYDPARLRQCRGRKYGLEAWAISAFWRIDGGPVQTFPVVMPTASGTVPTFVPDASGRLELWFSNSDAFGCIAWDSAYGANYAFDVEPAVIEPGWMGEPQVVISRATCSGGPCDADLRSLDGGFLFDTWARQRATVAEALFRVWAPGVTDRDNPDLWQQLDARVHWRAADTDDAFDWAWVDYDRRVGNDARYAVPLRSIDPLPGATVVDPADCPAYPLEVTPDGQYVETELELYFSVNGFELRPADGTAWRGRFQDYIGLYSPCL